MHIVALFAAKAIGILAVAVGVAGIVLPVIPGWVLIFIGLNILGVNIYFWRKKRKKNLPKSRSFSKK